MVSLFSLNLPFYISIVKSLKSHSTQTRAPHDKGFSGEYTTAGNPKYYKYRTTSLYRETSECPYAATPTGPNIKIEKANQEALLQNLSSASVAYDRLLRYW